MDKLKDRVELGGSSWSRRVAYPANRLTSGMAATPGGLHGRVNSWRQETGHPNAGSECGAEHPPRADRRASEGIAPLQTLRLGVLQKVFQKHQLQLKGLSRRDVRLARGQESTVLVAKQGVDGHEVVESLPVPGRVLHAARNEHRARRHQGV